MTQVDTGQWITLQEASRITGRSINSLRLLIRRRKLSPVLKVKGKHGDEWKIHRDTIHDLSQGDQGIDQGVTQVIDYGDQHDPGDMTRVITLPAEVFMQQQKERDEMAQGLMMYRYKFEELERRVRLLPAPVEAIGPKMQELEAAKQQEEAKVNELQQNLHDKEHALVRAEEILKKAREDYDLYKTSIVELKEKLQEEGRVKAELRRELEMERRPWWKKVIGLK